MLELLNVMDKLQAVIAPNGMHASTHDLLSSAALKGGFQTIPGCLYRQKLPL